jgi:hypothetical protein
MWHFVPFESNDQRLALARKDTGIAGYPRWPKSLLQNRRIKQKGQMKKGAEQIGSLFV